MRLLVHNSACGFGGRNSGVVPAKCRTMVDRRFGLLASTSLLVALLHANPAEAACSFAPTAGDDTFICDSGTSVGGLSDLAGNNTLLFPNAGTGILDGNVEFGPGTDRIEMNSGTITGIVNQGDGADSFEINNGTVIGNVQQGSGTDDFG
jgi:autotransporter family porin